MMSKYSKTNYKMKLENFIKYKDFKEILGENYQLSEMQKQRLQKVFDNFNYKELQDFGKVLSYMIYYDLCNYYKRIKLIKSHKFHYNTKIDYVIKYGKENGIRLYNQYRNKRATSLPSSISYWKNKGFSDIDAHNEVTKFNKMAAQYSAQKVKGTSEYTVRSIKYWLKQGYSEQEAKEKVKQIQGFTLQKCIDKYGEEKGNQHYNDRQNKWMRTLQNKTDEEKQQINLKKGHSIESYIANGFTEDEATKLSIQYYSKRRNYSNISQEFFKKLDEYNLGNTYFKTKNYEKQFNGKNIDWFNTDTKIGIEFYGDYWHCRPTKYEKDFIRYKLTAKEVWDNDEKRLKEILKSDKINDIIIVWEGDFRKNPTQITEKTVLLMEKILNERDGSNSKRIETVI